MIAIVLFLVIYYKVNKHLKYSDVTLNSNMENNEIICAVDWHKYVNNKTAAENKG